MRRFLVLLCVLFGLIGPANVAWAQSSPCTFVLGFQTVFSLIPTIVGGCVDNEQHNPANGDALQQTAKGLLVWRKADNFTAFTDGFRSWVNGPAGIQERLNSQRFAWEANPTALPVVSGGGVDTAAAPVISASLSSGMTRLSALIGTSLDWTDIDAAFHTTVDDAYAAPLIPLAGTSEAVVAPANSTYLLIFTTTKNAGTSALPMDVGFGVALVDSQGNRYKSDIKGTVYAQQLYQYMDDIISLQPSQTARSTTAYIVPSSASGFQMAAVYAPIPSLAPPAPPLSLIHI